MKSRKDGPPPSPARAIRLDIGLYMDIVYLIHLAAGTLHT